MVEFRIGDIVKDKTTNIRFKVMDRYYDDFNNDFVFLLKDTWYSSSKPITVEKEYMSKDYVLLMDEAKPKKEDVKQINISNLKVGDRVQFVTDTSSKYLYNETKIHKGTIIKVTGIFKDKYLIKKKTLHELSLTDVCILVSKKNILNKLED